VIHRNLTVAEQAEEVRRAKDADVLVGAAVGVAGDADERLQGVCPVGQEDVVVIGGDQVEDEQCDRRKEESRAGRPGER